VHSFVLVSELLEFQWTLSVVILPSEDDKAIKNVMKQNSVILTQLAPGPLVLGSVVIILSLVLGGETSKSIVAITYNITESMQPSNI